MNLEDFRLLYEYNSWANRRSLDACSLSPTNNSPRDIGSSFRSVRDTLSHICEVEWLWLERGMAAPQVRSALLPTSPRSPSFTAGRKSRPLSLATSTAKTRRHRPSDRT